MAHLRHGEPDARTSGAVVGHRRYDVIAPILFAGRRRRVFAGLAAESGARPGDRVLDVGCGTGYFTRTMAAAVTPGGAAQGVDPPTGRIGRHLIATHSPAMANNRVELLEPIAREAGFEQPRTGDLLPWIHYVQARKPSIAPSGT